jgi:hypothetical protein
MNKSKRLTVLPFIGLVLAVLLIGALYMLVQNRRQAKELTSLKDATTRHQEEQRRQGRPIDPRDYPTFSPAPIGETKQATYDGAQLSFSYPASWKSKEELTEDNQLLSISIASQEALLKGQQIPADQGKVNVRLSSMSWLANVEQLAGAYATSNRKITVNNRQVFEITNEDPSSGTNWIESYIVPESSQQPFIVLTTYPAKSEAAKAAHQIILQTVKVK